MYFFINVQYVHKYRNKQMFVINALFFLLLSTMNSEIFKIIKINNGVPTIVMCN